MLAPFLTPISKRTEVCDETFFDGKDKTDINIKYISIIIY